MGGRSPSTDDSVLRSGRRDPGHGRLFYLPSAAPLGPARISATSLALSSPDSRRMAAASSSTVSRSVFPPELLVQAGVQAEGVGAVTSCCSSPFEQPSSGAQTGRRGAVGPV